MKQNTLYSHSLILLGLGFAAISSVSEGCSPVNSSEDKVAMMNNARSGNSALNAPSIPSPMPEIYVADRRTSKALEKQQAGESSSITISDQSHKDLFEEFRAKGKTTLRLEGKAPATIRLVFEVGLSEAVIDELELSAFKPEFTPVKNSPGDWTLAVPSSVPESVNDHVRKNLNSFSFILRDSNWKLSEENKESK